MDRFVSEAAVRDGFGMRARIRDWGRGASALKILRAAYNIASSRSSVGPDRNEDSYMPFKGMSQANVDGGLAL